MHWGSGRRTTAAALATTVLVAGFAVVVGPTPAGAREEHALGVVTETFVDKSRPTPRNGDRPETPGRSLETTIWYPAVGGGSDAPDTAGGPYPFIVFAQPSRFDRSGGTSNPVGRIAHFHWSLIGLRHVAINNRRADHGHPA